METGLAQSGQMKISSFQRGQEQSGNIFRAAAGRRARQETDCRPTFAKNAQPEKYGQTRKKKGCGLPSFASMASTVVIDGARLEGGGQVVRASLALACLLQKRLEIRRIRANRGGGGGLRAQHLAGARLCAVDLAGGTLQAGGEEEEEDSQPIPPPKQGRNRGRKRRAKQPEIGADGLGVGSRALVYEPPPTTVGGGREGAFTWTGEAEGVGMDNGDDDDRGASSAAEPVSAADLVEATADTRTAGSTLLLVQVALLQALFHESGRDVRLRLIGGTNAIAAPQVDYTQLVFEPLARQFGADFSCAIERRGFFPQGQGVLCVDARATRGALTPVKMLTRGKVVSLRGRIFAAGFPSAERAREAALRLKDQVTAVLAEEQQQQQQQQQHLGQQKGLGLAGVPIDIEIDLPERGKDSVGKGTGVVLVAICESGCRLGGSGLDTQDCGTVAATALLSEIAHGGCVDEWAQDQLVVLASIANGESAFLTGPLSLHTRTAIDTAQRVAGAQFDVRRVIANTSRNARLGALGAPGALDALDDDDAIQKGAKSGDPQAESQSESESERSNVLRVGQWACGPPLDVANEESSQTFSAPGNFVVRCTGIGFSRNSRDFSARRNPPPERREKNLN
jgi:RNA 3'-terminal phosphate cyclase (ATP)